MADPVLRKPQESAPLRDPSSRPSIRPRDVAIAAGGFAVALALTALLRPLLGSTVFVFMYGAVAIAALFAGAAAGIAAAVLSVLIVARYVIPLSFDTAAGATSVAAFLGVSTMLSFMGRSLRFTRYRAEASNDHMREIAREMTVRQAEAESLAAELEESSVELETAMEDANEQRNAALANEERMRLLDDAGRVLASSLDYETTVRAVAQLAVPKFADWVSVQLLVDGKIEQLALAHVDPAKVEWARSLNVKYPPDPNSPTGAPAVIRSGKAQLIADVTDEMLVATARDADHLKILRDVGVHSVIIVPMVARGHSVGAMTLVSSKPSHHYTESDLALMEHLGRRAAMAIDNARLYRAALVANEAKANFLATMSHELRTPLTAIIGYEELLAEGISGEINDQQRQQLQRIKMSASHLLTLIDEILLYARVEAGRETVQIEPVAAKGVIDDAIAFVLPSAAEKSLALGADGVDPALMLDTDLGKLRQMLLNLLANAVKFTSQGKVTVRAFAQGDKVVFEVIDTGIGISREDLTHVFDPFWQVDQNTTRRAGGSGLGLSVTKRLANLLGGNVSAESEPQKGSTFRIELPKTQKSS